MVEQICCNHGYVHLYHDYVLKYIYLKNSQWIKEAWILHVLLPYKHPHIGTFESMWIDKPYCIMRMPRYDKTLHYGLLPDCYQWYQVIWDITSSLCLLHSLSLIHYDIKMDNICVTREGRGVLIDFGLGEHQRNEFMINTKSHIHYRPPENMTFIHTHEYHSRRHFTSDIWSLGIVYFELCTGLTVFELFQLLYHQQTNVSCCGLYFPWKRKLKRLATTLHHKPFAITYSEDYIYECLYRDHEEVYLYFLSLVFLKYHHHHSKERALLIWSQFIYPMLRHDPCKRITAMELYKRFTNYKTSLHFTPPLMTVTDHINQTDQLQNNSFQLENENELLQSILKSYYSQVPESTQRFIKYFIQKGFMTKDNFTKYNRALHQIELIVEDKLPYLQPILSSEILFILQHYIYIS